MATANPPAAPPAAGPTHTTIRASWQGDKRFRITNAHGATGIVDGSGALGPGAIDTLLGALAACASMDVVPYLEKRRTPCTQLDVVVTGTRRAAIPRRVVAIDVEFQIRGSDIEREHAERAASLALGRYCSVASSLGADIALALRVSLNDDAATPVAIASAAD